jgi:hypothetical protein
MAAVEIWLADAPAELLGKLKAMGFQAIGEPRVANVLVGWIPVNKLSELARLPQVRHVAPHRVK